MIDIKGSGFKNFIIFSQISYNYALKIPKLPHSLFPHFGRTLSDYPSDFAFRFVFLGIQFAVPTMDRTTYRSI